MNSLSEATLVPVDGGHGILVDAIVFFTFLLHLPLLSCLVLQGLDMNRAERERVSD